MIETKHHYFTAHDKLGIERDNVPPDGSTYHHLSSTPAKKMNLK